MLSVGVRLRGVVSCGNEGNYGREWLDKVPNNSQVTSMVTGGGEGGR